MDQLDEPTRERLSRQLLRNKTLPFDDDFRRTTDLERHILDRYGRPGAEFLLRQNGFAPAFDHTCPWPIAGLDAHSAVQRVLAPVRLLLPNFMSALEERIRWVIPAQSDGGWVLVYVVDHALYDGRPYYALIIGGAPNPAPRLSERAHSLGWVVPRSLRTLCLVHDGFGKAEGGILASGDLVDLGQMMDPIAAEQGLRPDGYTFQDLLEFRPDGAGNCQAFHRRSVDDPDPHTVDWDHETHEISCAMSFFDYADEELLRQISDEE